MSQANPSSLPGHTLPDVIDLLVGIEPGDHLDTLRRHRLQARTHAQESYRALFAPTAPAPGAVTVSYLAARNPMVPFHSKDDSLLNICKEFV